MMRIITGRAKGVHLVTLAGDATRPTSERAKEAIFSMLQFELEGGEVLDVFSGSGQMALEAVSRGAKHAVLGDSSRVAVDVIRENTLKSRLAPFCEVFCMDYTALIKRMKGRRFDFVFLDPPYALGLVPDALRRLVDEEILAPGARIICETAHTEDVFNCDASLSAHFDILRTARYGIAQVTVLRFCGKES